MVVLDTDVLSEFTRKRPNPEVITRVRGFAPEELYTTVINVMELRYGSARRLDFEVFWNRIKDEILSRVGVLGFDGRAALVAGDVRARLEAQGEPLALPDLVIASIALSHGAGLLTGNDRHFRRVPGLLIID
jgi:predicted nucleic acid-binding protein